MVKKGKRTQERDRSRLDELSEQLVEIEERIRAFEEEHEEIFAELKEMTDEKNGIFELLKAEARLHAKDSATVVLLDSSKLHVSVVQPKRPVSYDFDLAMKHWGPKTVDAVRVRALDAKLVENLSTLSEEDREKVKKLGPAPTARVTITLP